MATPIQVKDYLACWFQLGKTVILDFPGGRQQIQPMSVLSPRSYSAEFETCWQQILARADHAYLAGTDHTITELLSDHYEMTACSRCSALVPISASGAAASARPCPCADLPTWPNSETIPPRSPQTQFHGQIQLGNIQKRLNQDSNPI
ncbi:MAG: hypothetical protein HC921_12555 [Synechococcaceae cyanobacterium SM2_3_1]|nr:hypothetical protein [Synechococcaceae cyanobacterium SM2_3_1]